MNKGKLRMPDQRQFYVRSIIAHLLVLSCFLCALTHSANAAGGSAPVLLSVFPANGTMAVPLTTHIEFHFDQPMKTNVDLGGIPPFAGAVTWMGLGFDTAGFVYSWSADARTLLCTYSGALPSFTSFNWLLNPYGSGTKLKNQTGVALAETFAGMFVTAGANQDCDPDGFPDNWGTYSVFFNSSYQQTSLAAPVPDVSRPAFWLSVSARESQQSGVITGGSLSRPNLSKNNLMVFLEVLGNFLRLTHPNPHWTRRFRQAITSFI